MSSCDLIFKLEQEYNNKYNNIIYVIINIAIFNLSVSCYNLNIKSQDDIFWSLFYLIHECSSSIFYYKWVFSCFLSYEMFQAHLEGPTWKPNNLNT